jgi:hypothetical protein
VNEIVLLLTVDLGAGIRELLRNSSLIDAAIPQLGNCKEKKEEEFSVNLKRERKIKK